MQILQQQHEERMQQQQLRYEEQLKNHQNALLQMVNKQDQQGQQNAAAHNDKIIRNALTQLREDVKTRLTEKCRVTLHTDNFEQWRTAILSDADMIGGLEMITEGQTTPPAEPALDKEIWIKKNEILRCRMIQSFSTTVRTQMNLVDESTASALYERIARDYGKSLAEERLMLSKELKEMKIENNDYLAYMRKVNSIRHKYAALSCPLDENILHDFFILGLGNWQSYFIKNKMDEFYSTKRDPIQNLNIDELMDQLAARVPKGPKDSKETSKPSANRVSTTRIRTTKRRT
jgi:hypothetical protein